MITKDQKDTTKEASDIMNNLNSMLKQMKGGDSGCAHDFEETSDGLMCTKCGGRL